MKAAKPSGAVGDPKNMTLALKVMRTNLMPTLTEGTMCLTVNGVEVRDFCQTLEPAVREKKIMGRTAIPAGVYEVKLGMSGKFHREMPYLTAVPRFSGIMIHPGNTTKDTQGCILVGRKTGTGIVSDSRKTFDLLFRQIKQAIDSGERVYITIENEMN